MRNSDSGVVIRMSGGLVANVRRSAVGVSPVRTPTCTSRTVVPASAAARPTPTSGERRLRCTSAASAFSGEMYSTRQRRDRSAGSGPVSRWSNAHRNAASVLPDPVGATTRVCSPEEIACHAPAWAGVGAAKALVNQDRVGVLKSASAAAGSGVVTTGAIVPPGTDSPRCGVVGGDDYPGRREALGVPAGDAGHLRRLCLLPGRGHGAGAAR